MSDCIFCRIINGEIPADRVYEDDGAIVIKDIAPMAPTHLLAIPKKHYPAVHDIPPAEMGEVMGGLMNALCRALEATGLNKSGYRFAVNSGDVSGQMVPHLHIHVLGGREFMWPPG